MTDFAYPDHATVCRDPLGACRARNDVAEADPANDPQDCGAYVRCAQHA